MDVLYQSPYFYDAVAIIIAFSGILIYAVIHITFLKIRFRDESSKQALRKTYREELHQFISLPEISCEPEENKIEKPLQEQGGEYHVTNGRRIRTIQKTGK